MKKRTPEEKARKEAEDIAKAEAAVENIKKPIRECLSFILEKIANFIKRIKRRKGDSANDWVFIGEKIGEGLRAGAGIEETPHYEIKGVDLAEAELEQQQKENLYRGLSNMCAALVKASKAAASASAALEFFGETLREYEKGMAEEHIQRASDAVDAFSYSYSFYDLYCRSCMTYPNKRVLHLSKHARKERVRKKNINRILKWYARGGH